LVAEREGIRTPDTVLDRVDDVMLRTRAGARLCRDRLGLRPAADANRHAVDLYLDDPGGSVHIPLAPANCARWQRRFHDRRHKLQRFGATLRQAAALAGASRTAAVA
jgi:hypothetical protein